MTFLYWEWHLIPLWFLRSIFARFPEQLLKGLVSWGSTGKYSMHDRLLLGRCFRGFVLPVLEYCSAVLCSAADTHLKLQDSVVSGASFLTGGVFECDLAHRRSVAALCMLYKVRCNPMYPLYGALPSCALCAGAYYTRCCDRTSVHLCASSLQNLGVPQVVNPLSVFCGTIWWPCIRWCGTSGFQEQGHCLLLA